MGIQSAAFSALLASALTSVLAFAPLPSHAADAASAVPAEQTTASTSAAIETAEALGFKVRTGRPDRTSIKLPTGEGIDRNVLQRQKSSLGGLVFLSNAQERPPSTGVLFITVQQWDDDVDGNKNRILAGAKVPMTKVIFPFQFTLGPQNVKSGVALADWTTALAGDDLLVQTFSCPPAATSGDRAVATNICPPSEREFTGKGISKWLPDVSFLLSSGGKEDGATSSSESDVEPVGLRAAVGMGLSRQNIETKQPAAEAVRSADDF